MIACDRCAAKKASVVSVLFKKYDGSNRQGRRMISSEVELCEACITDYLKAFGVFKSSFMNEGDEPDPKNPDQHRGGCDVRKVRCKYCRLPVGDDRVQIGKYYRHPTCEKPAREAMPERPLTPGEREERREDAPRQFRGTSFQGGES